MAPGQNQAGAPILHESFDGGEDQNWQLQALGNGYYYVVNELTGKVLDVPEPEANQNGLQVQQWDLNSGLRQQWQFVANSGSGAEALFLMGNKTVDAQAPDINGYYFTYAYAPSIINDNGPWRMYFCSGGGQLPSHEWDAIRLIESNDQTNWFGTRVVLQVSDPINERTTCDPSVVYYDAGDGPYHYMFYDGNSPVFGTSIYVARSATYNGPFLKYTQNGTWELNPSNPKIIIAPAHPSVNSYGAGQQSVVSLNEVLYMWCEDTTENSESSQGQVLFSASSNAVSWSSPLVTNLEEPMGDVKWDRARNLFVWVTLLNGQATSDTWVTMRTSVDGDHWINNEVIDPANDFAGHYASNPGLSGDNHGWIMSGLTKLFFAAPYNLDPTYHYTCSSNDIANHATKCGVQMGHLWRPPGRAWLLRMAYCG